jgi:glycosyltransferase involved in cell wall biosynthesis
MVTMKKNNCEISIIVVSLNTKVDTIKTINSILIQSYKDYEILVIDGKSTDGTVEFLKKNNNKINFISEKDKGIYFAMNKGVKLANSNWTIFLNSGDVFATSKVLHNFIKSKNINYADIVYGDTIVKNKLFDRFLSGKNFSLTSTIMPFCHQSVLVRTDILKKKLFKITYKIAADFDLFYRLFKDNKKFYYLDCVISKIVTGGISDKKRLSCLLEYFHIFYKNKNYCNIFLLFFDLIYFFLISSIKKMLNEKLIKKILIFKYTIKNQIKN